MANVTGPINIYIQSPVITFYQTFHNLPVFIANVYVMGGGSTNNQGTSEVGVRFPKTKI